MKKIVMLLCGLILTATLFAQNRTAQNPCLQGEVLMMDETVVGPHETISINARKTTWWNSKCEVRHSLDVDSLLKQKVTRVYVCKDTTTKDLTPKGLPLLQMQPCTTIVNCPPPAAPPATCCPADTAWREVMASPFLEGTTLTFDGAPDGGLKPFGGVEVSLTGYRAKTKDSNKPYIKSGFEPEIGFRLSVGKADPEVWISCDTCWFWGPSGSRLGFQGVLFAQMRWVAPTTKLHQPKNQVYYYLGPRIVAFEYTKGNTHIPGKDGLLLQGGVGMTFFHRLNLELNTFYSASQRFGFAVEARYDLYKSKEKQEPKPATVLPPAPTPPPLTYDNPRFLD